MAHKLSKLILKGHQPSDYKYKHLVGAIDKAALPTKVDLRPHHPSIFDQKNEGSCGSNSFVAHLMSLLMKLHPTVAVKMLSRNQHYYCARVLEGDPGQDGGQTIQDAQNVGQKTGVCLESMWPYTEADMYNAPNKACYKDAATRKTAAYYAVQNEDEMRHCLASGYSVQIGIVCPQMIMNSDPLIKINNLKPEDVLLEDGQPAGHAVLVVGYDGDWFIVRNSWGASWSPEMGGHFLMHKSVLFDPNWASDFYTARLATELKGF